MQINELKIAKRKKRKRIGRGGKRGTYSGKGNKGQKARSGAKIDPLFEGGRSSLTERMKKIGGFKSIKPKKINFNLDILDKNFKEGEEISPKSLMERGLIKKVQMHSKIKILGDGKISKKLTFAKEISFSESAKKALQK